MFVVDAPGGGGKILLAPDAVAGRDGDDLLLRNFEGKIYRYPDPGGTLGREQETAATPSACARRAAPRASCQSAGAHGEEPMPTRLTF